MFEVQSPEKKTSLENDGSIPVKHMYDETACPIKKRPLWYHIYFQQTQLHAKGIAGSLGEGNHLKKNLITINYAQTHDLLFQFFIKVVVNKCKAYSFLIIGMMILQRNISFS